MESIAQPDWLKLPALVQTRIMMKVGLASLGALHTCRQVCRAWNVEIVNNVWDNSTNKNKLENKLKEHWKTGTPKYEKTEQIFESRIEILTATGDCLVLIDPKDTSSLRVIHGNEEEWSLKIEGYVTHCFVTNEILVVMTRNMKNDAYFYDPQYLKKNPMFHKMEIYDPCSRAKIMERSQNGRRNLVQLIILSSRFKACCFS